MIRKAYIDGGTEVTYDEQSGQLTIDSSLGVIHLFLDEATTLAEKLQEWLLQDE